MPGSSSLPTRFSGFVLTDGTGAERLDRFTPTPGAIVLADRCYARHGGMAAVWGQGADLVVRYGLSSSAVREPGGARVTLNGVLGRPGLPDQLDLPVELPGPGGRWHPGRLILMRRPAGSAAKSRARIDQKARKRGGTATLKQQRAADWLVLLTTLAAADWPAPRVMALYRLRWQIELAFKRLKSQTGLADLQAKDPQLARACILAKLILALLVGTWFGYGASGTLTVNNCASPRAAPAGTRPGRSHPRSSSPAPSVQPSPSWSRR